MYGVQTHMFWYTDGQDYIYSYFNSYHSRFSHNKRQSLNASSGWSSMLGTEEVRPMIYEKADNFPAPYNSNYYVINMQDWHANGRCKSHQQKQFVNNDVFLRKEIESDCYLQWLLVFIILVIQWLWIMNIS